jgi:hypothetical protein
LTIGPRRVSPLRSGWRRLDQAEAKAEASGESNASKSIDPGNKYGKALVHE